MPDMLKRFWLRSEQAIKVRLETEVLDSAKALRLTEVAHFEVEDQETCNAWVDAQERFNQAVDGLIEIERR